MQVKHSPRRRASRMDNQRREDNVHRSKLSRVNVVYGLVFLSFLFLTARLGYLQITMGAKYAAIARASYIATIPVLPTRGRIYDTNGILIAYDKPTMSVYYTQIAKLNTSGRVIRRIARMLAPQFGTTSAKVSHLISSNRKFSTIRLFKGVTNKQLAYIAEHQSGLPGISIETDGIREYPYGDLAGQVLGYVGRISPSQYNDYVNKRHYLPDSTVGVAGIEQQYESYLRGQAGKQIENISTTSGLAGEPSYERVPVSGNNIQLTLDGRLQADAQNFVQQAIQQYSLQHHVQITAGSAVAIDVKTGGILAMVSYPYFDPNWYINGDFTKHIHYLSASGAQMNNVIQNPHYPGSTVKPANMITGLDHGTITPATVYDDSVPSMYIGNHQIKEDASYGPVSDIRAISVSDDRFFYSLGLELGKWFGSSPSSGGYPLGGNLQRWRDTWFIKGLMALVNGEARFGLGLTTGIDLPGEQHGWFYMEDNGQTVTVPTSVVQAALKAKGSYKNYGSPFDLALMAFGQSQQFTPIELAQYVSTIANKGVRLEPHLLQRVLSPGMQRTLSAMQASRAVSSVKPTIQARLKLNRQYLSIVQDGMYAACNSPEGTAYGSFFNAPYKAAGKTGTAEIVMHGQLINNSVFIGYAPYNNPQIAIAVMVPGAGFGATTAVPIARAIMDDYFKERHQGFFPAAQWVPIRIPTDWMKSPAYTAPETAH